MGCRHSVAHRKKGLHHKSCRLSTSDLKSAALRQRDRLRGEVRTLQSEGLQIASSMVVVPRASYQVSIIVIPESSQKMNRVLMA